MTKVMVEPIGWVYLVVVLDWYSKKIVATTRASRPRRPTGWSR